MVESNIVFDRRSTLARRLVGLEVKHVRRISDLREELRRSRRGDRWILRTEKDAETLVKTIDWPAERKLGDLIVMDHLRSETLEPLLSSFIHVAFAGKEGAMLPPEELAEALTAENRGDLAVAGVIDFAGEILTAWRGDLSSMVVPLKAFEPNATEVVPDFRAFTIVDYGNTLRFGRYEAAFDAVLYEYDPEYRRRLKRRRQRHETGFGPSLRRLRLQKKLARDDFGPLSAKTIARIERREVEKPHLRTVNVIAKRLGVEPGEIESF